MKFKTIELTGYALNWAVAKSQASLMIKDDMSYWWSMLNDWNYYGQDFNYDTDLEKAGQIILDHDISIIKLEQEYLLDSYGDATGERRRVYGAVIGDCFDDDRLRNSYGQDCGSIYFICTSFVSKGPTALIAAMRCFVLSKMGDEVEIPKSLTS
jgi:hypothetical protein